MAWKIYFLIVAFLFLISAISYLTHPVGFVEGASFFLGFAMIIGMFCYVFDKYALNSMVWKIVFWGNIFIIPFNFIFSQKSGINENQYEELLKSPQNMIGLFIFFIVGFLFVYPSYFAIFSLGKGKTHKTNPMGGIGLQITKLRRK